MGLFLGLILTLLALNFLRNALNRYIYRYLLLMVGNNRLATILFALLFLPGVVLHEASHWVMAKILLVKTHHFSLMPEWVEDGTIRFGFVEIDRKDRIRSAFIALAPLLSGVFVTLWIAFNHLNLDVMVDGLIAQEWDMLKQGLGLFLDSPDLFLWVYFLFTISNTMLPSTSDRKVWLPMGAIFAVIYVIIVLISSGSATGSWLIQLAREFAMTLLQVFGIASIVNICLVVPFFFIERVVKRGRRILPSI